MAKGVTIYRPPSQGGSYLPALPHRETGIAGIRERWRIEHDNERMKIETHRNEIITGLRNSQTARALADARAADATYELAMRPDRFAHRRTLELTQMHEEVNAARHTVEMNDVQRQIETKKLHKLLVDANQDYDAQVAYGFKTYELDWIKKQAEILDYQLDNKEKRKAFRKASQPDDGEDALTGKSEEEIKQALLTKRDYLNANGLDASKIEAAIGALDDA